MASGDENNYLSLSAYINDLKSSISAWEDMAMKSQKLNTNLKITVQNFNSIAESLTLLSDIKDNSKFSGLYQAGNLLSDIGIQEKSIANKLSVLNSSVQNNLASKLSFHIDSWKRTIANIKKDCHTDRKRAKIDLKKAESEFSKLESKSNKRLTINKFSLSDTFSLQIDYAKQNLQNKQRFLEELERCSLRKVVCEERNRYKQFIDCLRPVLDAQLSMKAELEELQLLYDKLYSSSTDDLSILPPDIDAYVREYQPVDSSRVSSVSSLYSRANSQLSLSGSHCSFESSYTLPIYCHMLNSSCSSSEFQKNDKQLDNSSSTIVDINANSSQYAMTDNNDSDEETSSSDEKLDQKLPSSVLEEPLYPNQAIPPPRYSNLRELKQIADKKYGTVSSVRDQTESTYGDCIRSSLFVNNDIPKQSHYQDNLNYSQNHNYKDIDGYGSVYDSISDVTNSTSTFKRRKPSVITAIETPKINNDRICLQNGIRSDIRNNRSASVNRSCSQISQVCSGVEKTHLGSRLPPSRNGGIENVRNSMYAGDIPMAQSATGMYMSTNQLQQQRITDNSFNCKNSLSNDLQFKQQLLKVIQGDRQIPQKPVSIISSQMF